MLTLALLRTNEPFKRLWAARTISYFGDSLSLVTLMLHVAQSAGQALAIALWLPALPMLLVLVGLRSVVAQIFQPASRAAVPLLVRADDLPGAKRRCRFRHQCR